MVCERHVVNGRGVEGLDHGPPRAHCRTARLSCAFASGTSRSERQSRMSGWMPIERSSFTECCASAWS